MNGKVTELPLITATPADIVKYGGVAPSATNPLPNRLSDGSVFYDARQIRALVNTDIVKAQLQDNAGAAITLGQKTKANSLPVVLSSDQYNSEFALNERGTLYSIVFTWTNVGTTEKNLFHLYNPSASGKTIKITKMIMTNFDTVGSFCWFRVYHTPTITGNGTGLTIVNRKIASAPTASIANAYRDPTTSSVGTLMEFMRTSGGAAGGNSFVYDLKGGLYLTENTRILITGTADGTNRDIALYLEWGEE